MATGALGWGPYGNWRVWAGTKWSVGHWSIWSGTVDATGAFGQGHHDHWSTWAGTVWPKLLKKSKI